MVEGKIIEDANNLYEGYVASKVNSSWKYSTQKFGFELLKNLYDLQNELASDTYITSPCVEFYHFERGKERHIKGNNIRDRVVRHVLCDKIINPQMGKYLIYDNGASVVNKGISFSRERFEKHLHDYVRKNGSNEGYILFGDFSKYYDNILHKKLLELYSNILDDYSLHIVEVCLKDSRVDVSFLSDEEIAILATKKYDSLEYCKDIPRELRTGKKYLDKSVNIGDQLSQSSGILYPTRIDNYIKIVRGMKYYGRYMDDFYIISDSKEELRDVLNGIKSVAAELGIFINDKKTHITKLSSKFTYLQIRYMITSTGHIVKRINPKTLTRNRRKLKKYKKKLLQGKITYQEIENIFKSWISNYAKLMSKKQINNIKELYKQLFGKEPPKWKKESTH